MLPSVILKELKLSPQSDVEKSKMRQMANRLRNLALSTTLKWHPEKDGVWGANSAKWGTNFTPELPPTVIRLQMRPREDKNS